MRGFGACPEVVVVLPGEAWRVKRPLRMGMVDWRPGGGALDAAA